MGFISKLFGSKPKENKTGGMEDFMTLVRVYFQASIAANVGITNLAMLPDLRTFKTTLKVPTQGNKLGVGEKSCKAYIIPMIASLKKLIKVLDAIVINCKMCKLISFNFRH